MYMKLVLRRTFWLIVPVYLLATLVHGPIGPDELEGVPHVRLGPFVLARPMVLSGDSPHYLAAVNSLIEDWDFDLKNNHDRAKNGSLDMGVRFRGRSVDRHVDVDSHGHQYGTHSPFFALLLVPFAAPFAGTQWVALVCIWVTMAAGLVGLWLYKNWLIQRRVDTLSASASLLLLALATPLLCYSRDIWTEPFILTIWLAMLISSNPVVLALLGFAGTLIKYPFAVVPVTMAFIAWFTGQRSRAVALLGSATAAMLVAIATIQWIFQDVDHFSLFHSGRHRGFDLPFDGAIGLLFAPETGLFLFFPFLVWSLLKLPKGKNIYLPAVAFFTIHAAYQGWPGGTGFSARYLVPMLPIMTIAITGLKPRSILFTSAAMYSLFWGLFGGFFPAFVYDRSPWGVVLHIWEHVGSLVR